MICEKCSRSIDALVAKENIEAIDEEENDKYHIPGYYALNRQPFKRDVHWMIAEQSGWISKWKNNREIVTVVNTGVNLR